MKYHVVLAMLFMSTAASAQENALTLSGGATVGPRYAGSDKEHAAPLLGIDYQMTNGLFASTLRGIGYGTALGPVQVSAALGYRSERSDTDRNGFAARGGDALRGMGDVKGSATAMLALSAPLASRVAVNASLEAPLTRRENGRTASVGLSVALLQERADQVSLGIAASAGDGKYLQTYFGVTPAQAARTRFARYAPRAGFYQTEANLTWTHALDARWSVTGVVAGTSLLRSAKYSPLAERRTAPSGALYVSYRY